LDHPGVAGADRRVLDLIRGTLDEFSLSDIAGLIARSRKSGALELSGAAGTGIVYFSDGVVCGARCMSGREQLGRKLVRAGVLTEAELHALLARQGQLRLRLGEAVVGEGLARHDQVEDALEEQVEDGVVGLLGMHPTHFTWRSGTPEEAPVTIDVESFMRGVGSRIRELEEIRRRIPTDELMVTLSPALPENIERLSVTQEQWRVLAMLATRRSIRDLVQYSGTGDYHTLRTIDTLMTTGLLEAGARPQPPASAPPNPPFARGATTPRIPSVPEGVRVEGVPSRRVIRLAEPQAPRPPGRFRIAVVSTSDRTRGPLAATLMRRATRGLPVAISSYGMQDLAGAAPTSEAIQAGRRLGVDLVGYRSTPLRSAVLADADLVLGFERNHLRAAISQGEAHPATAFTMVELLALLGSVPPGGPDAIEHGRLTVMRADEARSQSPPRGDLRLEVPPMEAPVDDLARFIDDACVRVRGSLFGEFELEKPGK
jgi:protein-tyrosine-phosphatase